MASAGRILIMPKGNYNASITYEMLDMVIHNGKSWVARKTVIGIEPSANNNEYWHDLVNITPENVGALPISGGTLSGNLRVEKALPKVQLKNTQTSRTLTIESSDAGVASFGNYLSDSEQTNLQVRKSSEGLSELLRIAVDGANSYRILGEHNVPLLKQIIFKSKVYSGTTDSNGFLKPNDLTVDKADVIFCRISSGAGFCTQYNDTDAHWTYKVENSDKTPISNQNVSIKVVYLEIL